MVLNAELRSLKRAALVAERVLGQKVSTNTIERICLDVADDVLAAEQRDWKKVITGEVVVPSLAIVEFDGGRIRTRQSGCGPGVHLEATGWNETKNAIFVSAASSVSEVDPQPDPPQCFLDPEHVAQLAESAKPSENTRSGHDAAVESDVDDLDDSTQVIDELKSHHQRLGEPPEDASPDDPRERLRLTIGYFENNRDRMDYVRYRRNGLPTTSAWMESAVKELNYRVKGTEMFWNNPTGAEAILSLRAATLSDDERLTRLLTHRPGQSTLRRQNPKVQVT